MKKRLMAAYPGAQWFEYEPINREAEIEGAKLAFGKPVRTVLHLDKASHVVSLDADLLGTHPASVRYSADWADARRNLDSEEMHRGEMSRVFMVETGLSVTGSVADVRLPVDPARLYAVARAIAFGKGRRCRRFGR